MITSSAPHITLQSITTYVVSFFCGLVSSENIIKPNGPLFLRDCARKTTYNSYLVAASNPFTFHIPCAVVIEIVLYVYTVHTMFYNSIIERDTAFERNTLTVTLTR